MNRVLCLTTRELAPGKWVVKGDVLECETAQDAADIWEALFPDARILEPSEEPHPLWVRLLNRIFGSHNIKVKLT